MPFYGPLYTIVWSHTMRYRVEISWHQKKIIYTSNLVILCIFWWILKFKTPFLLANCPFRLFSFHPHQKIHINKIDFSVWIDHAKINKGNCHEICGDGFSVQWLLVLFFPNWGGISFSTTWPWKLFSLLGDWFRGKGIFWI